MVLSNSFWFLFLCLIGITSFCLATTKQPKLGNYDAINFGHHQSIVARVERRQLSLCPVDKGHATLTLTRNESVINFNMVCGKKANHILGRCQWNRAVDDNSSSQNGQKILETAKVCRQLQEIKEGYYVKRCYFSLE
jgi:hypothetical protein